MGNSNQNKLVALKAQLEKDPNNAKLQEDIAKCKATRNARRDATRVKKAKQVAKETGIQTKLTTNEVELFRANKDVGKAETAVAAAKEELDSLDPVARPARAAHAQVQEAEEKLVVEQERAARWAGNVAKQRARAEKRGIGQSLDVAGRHIGDFDEDMVDEEATVEEEGGEVEERQRKRRKIAKITEEDV